MRNFPKKYLESCETFLGIIFSKQNIYFFTFAKGTNFKGSTYIGKMS